MLIQFSVSNFMSMREEVTLSLLASAGTDHQERLMAYKKENILPSIAIYGANAAGKSNIFKAMACALVTLRTSASRQINSPIQVMPFLFDDESKNHPTTFDFIFTIGDTKYQYGYSADQERIYDEYLYAYFSSRPTTIFERANTSEMSYTATYASELKKYEEFNADNKLFLATATAWNSEITRAPYMWLAESIDVYDIHSLEPLSMKVLEEDQNAKRYMQDMLQQADLNISSYTVKTEEASQDDYILQLPPQMKSMIRDAGTTLKKVEISTHHSFDINGIHKDYSLPLGFESNGTQRFFFISPIIKQVLAKGKTMIMDEMDQSLHPMLMKYIIGLFNDPEINKNHAQLIFNSHDMTILDLDIFRRDQIYFAEKNNQNGVTDLYSLDEFSPRKSENVAKGYLQGRYGAIPAIGIGDVEW